jgi:hypothetical protein
LKKIAELNNIRDQLKIGGKASELIDAPRISVLLVERSITRNISAKILSNSMWCRK